MKSKIIELSNLDSRTINKIRHSASLYDVNSETLDTKNCQPQQVENFWCLIFVLLGRQLLLLPGSSGKK